METFVGVDKRELFGIFMIYLGLLFLLWLLGITMFTIGLNAFITSCFFVVF